ncbi:MAG: cation:proton antiporter [Deltaproteobacteria bacterium]|nr:cation:proton antiporter [Deltaproteobacteria bacterium]
MTYILIIALCAIVLISYVFDISASKTRIPSVILLLAVGIALKLISHFLDLPTQDLKTVLPLLGTIGLILIVLEGTLEIRLGKEKTGIIKSSFLSAVIALFIFTLLFSLPLHYLLDMPYRDCLLNALPFGVISSAIAIPTARVLDENKREFVVYESSISDILGIMLFDYFASKQSYLSMTVKLPLDILAILIIAVAASLLLGYIMNKIHHHIKFVPIVTTLILVYALAKMVHLPALLLILIFGLFLNNARLLLAGRSVERFMPTISYDELKAFKLLVGETTFLVRSFFFIMFGYYTDIFSLADPKTIAIAIALMALAIGSRGATLKALREPLYPLIYIAPRGLISILLFLSIPAASRISWINEGLLAAVIIISALFMMFGMGRLKASQ